MTAKAKPGGWGASDARSVTEVPHPGEQHRQPRFIGRRDHLVVATRAARLDAAGRARLDRGEQAVGDGEKGVARDRAADGAGFGPRSEERRVGEEWGSTWGARGAP